MVKRIKPAIILTLIMALLSSLVVGCGSEKTGLDASKTDDYTVNLGYYNCDHMVGACIAKDAGIFDELGLKVNVTGNGQVPEAMAAAKMDVG